MDSRRLFSTLKKKHKNKTIHSHILNTHNINIKHHSHIFQTDSRIFKILVGEHKNIATQTLCIVSIKTLKQHLKTHKFN